MTTIAEYNKYGEELERIILLRTSPIAVKMLKTEADIPEGAIRPKRDRGHHIAQCQAFALSRRQKETIAMLEEDSWCFAPIVAYGLEDKPEEPEYQRFVNFPTFERNKYIGIVSAPLKKANFEPDVIIIYSNTAQLRNMLVSISEKARDRIDYNFFPPACGYQVVPVMLSGHYVVTLPDPGDYIRALAGEDEIILSVPAARIDELISSLREFEEREASYTHARMLMLPDFPQPPMYQTFFKKWGLYEDDKDNREKK